jgi:8-oxo-dGTP pyrophosphatase MutT (NUDIX family)
VINPYKQYGALPYIWSRSGELKVMLVTTRGRKRWMIPKGWPIRGLTPHESAAREAYEEAGLVGHAYPDPIGSFDYVKRLSVGLRVRCRVEVFPLWVDHQRQSWPERGERETKWFSPKKAVSLILEPTLRDLLLHFHSDRSLPKPELSLGSAAPYDHQQE